MPAKVCYIQTSILFLYLGIYMKYVPDPLGCQYFFRPAICNDPAFIQHHNSVTVPCGQIHIMDRCKNRFILKLPHNLHDIKLITNIKMIRRLI